MLLDANKAVLYLGSYEPNSFEDQISIIFTKPV